MSLSIIKILTLLVWFYLGVLILHFIIITKRDIKNVDKKTWIESLWEKYVNNIKILNEILLHISMPAIKLAKIIIITACSFGILLWLVTGAFLLFLIFPVITYILPNFLLNYIRKRRSARIEAQLIPALVLVNNSLKAGLDIIQGFGMAVRDLDPPIGEEFEIMLKEYSLGTTFEEALINMRDRVNSKSMETFVTSLIIQRESGGNVTKILSRIIETVRETAKLDAKVNTLTSQGKIQSWIIIGMPWGMGILLFIIQPSFIMPLFTTTLGQVLLGFMAFWQFLGMLVIKKITTIEV